MEPLNAETLTAADLPYWFVPPPWFALCVNGFLVGRTTDKALARRHWQDWRGPHRAHQVGLVLEADGPVRWLTFDADWALI